ncbi:MAG: hypothetical protein WCS94_21665, partial [Verrucomicrobiota bacterium]
MKQPIVSTVKQPQPSTAVKQTAPRNGCRQLAAVVITGLLLLGASARAAPITWGSVTTVAGNSDVSTTGNLVYAERAGSATTLSITGVSFTAPGTYVTGWGASQTGIGSPSGITGDYAALLDGDCYQDSTLTLNGLTAGHDYLVQFWCNDARGGAANQLVTLTAGNAVVLNRNTGSGYGQWVTGTFTANATTQIVTVASTAGNQGIALNGVQVRDVTGIILNGTFIWSNGSGTGNWNTSDTNWTGRVWSNGFSNNASFVTVGSTINLSAIVASNILFGTVSANIPNASFNGGSLQASSLTVQGGSSNTNGTNPTLTLNVPSVSLSGDIAVGRANLTITGGA